VRKVQSVPNRVDQVYAILRDSICNGVFQPGMHMVQEDLAARLEVSRQPIQQALLLLKADGLIIESGSRGLYVAPMDPGNIVHHYQIRLQLDRLAASLLLERLAKREDGVAQQLETRGRALIAQGVQAQESAEAAEAVRLDMTFHSLIYDCSGNPLIASVVELHWNFLRRVMISILLHAGRGKTVWREHEEILELMLAGKAEEVDRHVTTHVLGAQAALLQALEVRTRQNEEHK